MSSTLTAGQVVTDDLRRWILAQIEAGCRPEDVLQAMQTSGWAEDVALDALELTLRQRLGQADNPTFEMSSDGTTPVPEPTLADAPATLLAEGHEVKVLMTLRHPRVILFGGLLSNDECDGLMALSGPRLLRSQTVDNATGGSEVNVARTSDGMFFERGEAPLIERIERRIAALVNWPLDHGEGLQILRYRPGAEYRPHHDYFDPAQPGTATILRRGGQRVATLLMYLHAPEAGGATVFPDAGLEIMPVRGLGVFFSYDSPRTLTRTLHGGAPVVRGEKWVATKWLRQGVFV